MTMTPSMSPVVNASIPREPQGTTAPTSAPTPTVAAASLDTMEPTSETIILLDAPSLAAAVATTTTTAPTTAPTTTTALPPSTTYLFTGTITLYYAAEGVPACTICGDTRLRLADPAPTVKVNKLPFHCRDLIQKPEMFYPEFCTEHADLMIRVCGGCVLVDDSMAERNEDASKDATNLASAALSLSRYSTTRTGATVVASLLLAAALAL